MKHKIASLVAVATAAVSIAAVAHAADNGDAAEATQKVTSPPVSEVSNWKDAGLRPANTSNVQALTRSLASIAESPEAVGPEEGTLDPSALRIAERIAEGAPGMPPGLLEGEEATAVADYVAAAAAQAQLAAQ